jgi:hypothetical protein
MSKKTMLAVLVLVAAAAVLLPMLGCQTEEPTLQFRLIFQSPDTGDVPVDGYYSREFAVTGDMLSVGPKTAQLSMTLSRLDTPSPNKSMCWYIMNSDQYIDFQLGTPSPQYMKAALDTGDCNIFATITEPGTYYAVASNQSDPDYEKRFVGSITGTWWVKSQK